MKRIQKHNRSDFDCGREKILIVRTGSIGDTVVSLPALRLIEKARPNSRRMLLTYISSNRKTAPVEMILKGTGLIHGSIEYRDSDLHPKGYLKIAKRIRSWNPYIIVYLMEDKGVARTLKDAIFFRYVCGVPKIIGLPPILRLSNRYTVHAYEGGERHESLMLTRRIRELGHIDTNSLGSYDLMISTEERKVADEQLSRIAGATPVLAISPGAKVELKDWGLNKWDELIAKLVTVIPGWGLIAIGAHEDRERAARLLKRWTGRSINLCGQLTPRESAAALERASLFIGHDSGPMHLASAVGTPCVAIFSARDLPGRWFPVGQQHEVIYHDVPCKGCQFDVCEQYKKRCITSITVEEVLTRVEKVVKGRR